MVISSGNGTTVLTLTASQTASLGNGPGTGLTPRQDLYLGGSGVTLASLLLLILPRRRRLPSLLVARVSVSVLGAAGCGSNGTLTTNTGTANGPVTTLALTGTYTVTVIATSTNAGITRTRQSSRC